MPTIRPSALSKRTVVGAHERGQVGEREDRRAPERRVCEVVERGPLRVRRCAACGRVVQHRQRNEPEVAVVHQDRARALAGQELAGEGVARRYCGAARRSASGVDGQSREGDEIAGDEQSQRAGGVCGDESHVRCAVVDYVEVRGRAALEGAVVGGAVEGVARGERAQARREPRGHGLGQANGHAVAGVAVGRGRWRVRVRGDEGVVDGVCELEQAEQLDWLRNDGAAVAKPELLARAERRHAHFGEGGRLSARVEQVVLLIEMNEHGAARYRAAVMLFAAHVVEEVERAVVAEALDDVLRGFTSEHDVRADEQRRACADDLQVGGDDDAVVEGRRRTAERDRAGQERVRGELREREHDVGDGERRRAHRPKRGASAQPLDHAHALEAQRNALSSGHATDRGRAEERDVDERKAVRGEDGDDLVAHGAVGDGEHVGVVLHVCGERA